MDQKTKKILTIAYIISFIPMILPQYGGCKGMDDVSGIINLLNPIVLLSVIMTITKEVSIQNSISYAFPEFYVGLGSSVIMILIYMYFAFFKTENLYGYEEIKGL